jgi:dTDP-4-amino-4,6-dideoxygalactose transaminase
MKITYGKHFIDQEDINFVTKSLKSNYITQGPNINLFEKKLKKKFNAKSVAVVSSGTAALHLAGMALGWKSKDIILTTPITFVATANAVLYAGAQLDFVDIETNSLNMDLDQLENKIKKLKNYNKKVTSVVMVDYAGNPCSWSDIKYLSNKFEFTVINDNCHAIGSRYKNSISYAVKYADVVTHSYHAVKNMTTGEGGAVLSLNKKIIDKIKILRTHGLKYFDHKKNKSFYDMRLLGYNYRLTDFQAALGISQLNKLDKFIKRRQEIAKIYDEAFKNNEKLIIPPVSKYATHSYHLYPLQIIFDKIKIFYKKKFFEKMKKKNIILQSHYMPIYSHTFYKKKFYKKNFPVSEKFYKNEVSMPIYYSLKNHEVAKIIKLINYYTK